VVATLRWQSTAAWVVVGGLLQLAELLLGLAVLHLPQIGALLARGHGEHGPNAALPVGDAVLCISIAAAQVSLLRRRFTSALAGQMAVRTWILTNKAEEPSAKPWMSYTIHSGFERSSGWLSRSPSTSFSRASSSSVSQAPSASPRCPH
jgi:hypothetical protein